MGTRQSTQASSAAYNSRHGAQPSHRSVVASSNGAPHSHTRGLRTTAGHGSHHGAPSSTSVQAPGHTSSMWRPFNPTSSSNPTSRHGPGHSSNRGSGAAGGQGITISHGGQRLISLSDIKCPVCNKTVRCIDDFEVHVVMCLTRPKLTYNEETVEEEREEECIICLEDFVVGETIARLPCLCVYHKHCLDEWFKVNNVCPQHPPDD